MAHDKNGTKLNIGDVVTVDFTVNRIHEIDGYCNAELVTTEVMYPSQNKTSLIINGRQCVKKDA